MKKRIHFKRCNGDYASITAIMRFKKPVRRYDVDPMAPYINKALADLTKDYPKDIVVTGWFFSATRQVVYVFLRVSRSFAKKNLKYGDYWAPEKYLGRYLSRVARRIRNSDQHFEKYFKDGMFKYHYIY